MFDEVCEKRITAIAPTKRDPQRGMVKVDGKVVATLNYTLIADLGLGVDVPWTIELAKRVERAVAYDKAYRAAMNRLNRRAMSSGQLRNKLKEKEHDDQAITEVIEQLTELGVLNDRSFGQALLREAIGRKPAGPSLIKQKLYQKGLSRDLIEQLVAEFTAEHDQFELAMRFAQVKLKSMQQLDTATKKRRLWGTLARRGFDSSVISGVMEQIDFSNEDDFEY